MNGFKGLFQRKALTASAMQALNKKVEQIQKNSSLLLIFFQEIVQLYQSSSLWNTKFISQFKVNEYREGRSKNIWSTLLNILAQQTTTLQQAKQLTEQTFQSYKKIFMQLNADSVRFEKSMSRYNEAEEILSESSKKYYKIHKNMLNAIELYKQSFSDVNLIYNMDEKIRRYENCQNLYKSAGQQFKVVISKCTEAMASKKDVSAKYKILLTQCEICLKKWGDHAIGKTQKVVQVFCNSSLSKKQICLSSVKNGSTIDMCEVFSYQSDASKLEWFEQKEKINLKIKVPLIFQYHHLLKQQYLQNFNSDIMRYIRLIEERLKVKRAENKKIVDVLFTYIKVLSRDKNGAIKELLINFEKNRKKLSEYFGNRLIVFFKSITSLLEINIGIQQKISDKLSVLFQGLQMNLADDVKLHKLFSEEINANMDKLTIDRLEGVRQDENIQVRINQNSKLREKIQQKIEFIKQFLSGFEQKINKNHLKFNEGLNKCMLVLSNASSQYYSYCNEYSELYFGNREFVENMQKYYKDFQTNRTKFQEQYNQLELNLVKNDEAEIVFHGDLDKIQDFKKLKKPKKGDSDEDKTGLKSVDSVSETNEVGTKLQSVSNEGNTDNETQKRNAKFLQSKIIFKENEKLVKTYSCALAEKIILQGKMYITTQRICFYSNFNSENIFFGRTFIQFPKADIKKIEKRKVSMVIDNSMSFTTVNGEIFFTSFFARDEAYDLICKTFNWYIDDMVYEYNEQDEAAEIPEFLIDYEENDDIKIEQIESRKQQIDKEIKNYEFVQAVSSQIVEEGLNALKIFKIFYEEYEVIFNNRKYESFLKYIKDILDHKDLEIQDWTPSISSLFNKSNIKENSPICCKRKVKVVVPVSAAGVPFMPKTGINQEQQYLYFYSKHKFVLQGTAETIGVPYCDTFKIELRTVVQSNDDGVCKVSISYYVNFIKNSMMKNMIQTKAKEETTSVSKLWVNEMKKYFEILHQKPKKGNLKKSVEELCGELQQAGKEIQNSREEKKALESKIEVMQKKELLWKKVLAGSIALHIIILLLFIF